MKYFLSLFASLLIYCNTYSQITLTGTVHCTDVTLGASVTGGIIPTSSGITADDNWSVVIPIGFTFDFYGTPNTSCIIGSNGCLGFDLANATAFNTWQIANTLLGSTAAAPDVVDCICGPWCDVYIPAGGTIDYSMQGTAPFRNFAVTWCGTAMFDCTTNWLTTQIIIYETTNIAEVHIGHHTFCTIWNGGYAEVGVKNLAGTLATTAPGRDFPADWNATDEAWRFTPVAGSYTVSSIPYAPIPYASSAVYWYDSSTGAYLGSGPTLTVTPVVGTTYEAAVLGCDDTTKAYIYTTPPGIGSMGGTIPHIDTYVYFNPYTCGVCNGSITLEGINPFQIDTVFYAFNHVLQPVIVTTAGIDSTITLSHLCAGLYDGIYVKVGTCPSNTVGPITLVGPVLAISSDTFTNPTVCGKDDGTIVLHGLFPMQPVSVSFNKNGAVQPAFTGVTLGDSSFTITGLGAGSYTNIIATIGLCSAPGNPLTLVNPPPYPARFTFDTILHCYGDQVIVINTSTPSGYYSYFYFGDGSVDSSGAIPLSHFYQDTPSYIGSYWIKLAYNSYHVASCTSYDSLQVKFNHQISASFTSSSNAVCLNTPITFTGQTISQNYPSFTWDYGNRSSVVTSPSSTATIDSSTYTYPIDGHYTTTLTVTDSIGCTAVATDTFDVIKFNVQTGVHDTSVCILDSMPLYAYTQVNFPWIGWNYSWTPINNIGTDSTYVSPGVQNYTATTNFFGVGTYQYLVTATTTYPVLTTNPNGCSTTDTETIISYPPVTLINVTASPQTIQYGSSIYLNASGAIYYSWTPDNGTLSNANINNPLATPRDSTTVYTVYGMNDYGCRDSANIVVKIDYTTYQGAPSAFTPNGDGLNDVFKITPIKNQSLVEMRIFNRWGQAVYYTNNPETGWDGTYNGVPQDLGVYSYEIVVALPGGSNQVYKGTLTLIR